MNWQPTLCYAPYSTGSFAEMLTYEEARANARRQLKALQEAWEQRLEFDVVESEAIEKPWGWIFFWNTRLYLETQDVEHSARGNNPLFVNRRDGSVRIASEPTVDRRELWKYEREIGARRWWRLW